MTDTDRPHILLVGGDGRPSGVPRHICDLAGALRTQALVSAISETDAGGYSALADLGARHIPVPGLASRLHPGALRAGYRALCRALNAHPADLVWLHARLPVLLGRYALARGDWQPAGRVALSYHGLPFGRGHRPGLSLASRGLEAALLRRCPPLELVFLSPAQAQRMARALPLGAHRSHVLANASHLGALPVPRTRPAGRHLVMTGRAGWQKNLGAAARLLKSLPPDIHLSLCGVGTDAPAFQARMRRLAGPAAARLTCLGALRDVRSLLASADGYLLTSRYEGLPIGALEAAEAGLPLICAPYPDAHEILDSHPLALRLGRKDDPARVDALLARYLADRPRHTAAIRDYWTARFSPARFGPAVRDLTARWLPPRPGGVRR